MATKILDYDVTRPPPLLPDLRHYERLRVQLFWGDLAIGKLTLQTGRRPISQASLIEAVTQHCLDNILQSVINTTPEQLAEKLVQARPGLPLKTQAEVAIAAPDPSTPVSIVIPTCDRPTELERCLASLVQLKSRYPFEIIVCDNRPASGLSEPIARRFPVKYVAEPRPGANYARNAGIAQASGEIIAFTDDDTVVTPGWLDALVQPFGEAEVMCVTGLVLPLELETPSQELFELYGNGGLERGFTRRKLGREFFKMWRGAVQTWLLGGTANCAVRAEVFGQPEIGPFDESLGPGTPTSAGEDIYLFYRILKAGYCCVYEPAARLYHRHRRDMSGLRRQLFGYCRGGTAQQLRTLLTDKDIRAIVQLLYVIPRWHFKRLWARLLGRSYYPAHLVLLEMLGHLSGFAAFFQSQRRATRLGRTTAAQLTSQRAQAAPLLRVNSAAPAAEKVVF